MGLSEEKRNKLVNQKIREVSRRMGTYPTNRGIIRDMNDKYDRGFRAEKFFIELARKKGFKVLEIPESVDKYNHIDVILIPPDKNIPLSFDVKGLKKIRTADKEPQDKYFWVEFVNDYGFKGWLFGDMDFIAFQIKNPRDGFLIVPRISLEKLVTKIVTSLESKYGKGNIPITQFPEEAFKKFYRRKGSKCLCLLIKRELIEKELASNISYWFF
jgi:hypothetical protein